MQLAGVGVQAVAVVPACMRDLDHQVLGDGVLRVDHGGTPLADLLHDQDVEAV